MPTALDHMILPVNDADESVAFYTGILGFGRDADSEPFTVVRVTLSSRCSSPWGTEGHWHPRLLRPRRVRRGLRSGARACHGDSFHEADNGRGPAPEDGARGPGYAVYLFDPNRHLIELRYYDDAEVGSPT